LKAVVNRRRPGLLAVALAKMRVISAEVKEEPRALARFDASRLPHAPKGSIFVGAGDSYAAALAGFYASEGHCIALDPYSLASNPEIARGLDVFFISVSGKTASNIAAAKRVAHIASRTIVLTAEAKGPLVKLADRPVILPMRYVQKTPGMLSFCLSLLAVVRIAGETARCDFQSVFGSAAQDGGAISSGPGTTYFLGNGLAYPAALYAAAKDYEFLGAKAHAELLEEFSHLELFSLGKSDVVNIFSATDPGRMAPRLAKSLEDAGYTGRVVPSRGRTKVEQLFHAVFVAQMSVLERAHRAGISEPMFLSSGSRLRVSDSMIY
jgi:fructoselysine-6-P-deglycase FrlB-like protein